MADTLETLEIEVKHNSKDAAQDVKKLAADMNELADALERVSKNSKGLGSINKSIKAATGGNSAYSKIRQETSRQTMSDAEFKSWYDDIQKRHQAELDARTDEFLKQENATAGYWPDNAKYAYSASAASRADMQSQMDSITSSGITDEIRRQAEMLSYETSQVEILETKISALQEKLAVAFNNNDSEKVARYTEQIQKLREKLDGLNNVPTDTISPEVRAQAAAFADSATEADLLRMKMEALQERLATAFNNNDNEKVANYTRQIQRLKDELNGVNDASEDAGKSEKGLLSRLADSSVGRIVKYRVIRGIIKDVANAAKEGLNNAYMFSKSIGGDMAKSMDSLATSLQTVKNQLGSALGSMLMALMPIITKVADAVTWLADKVTQLFAALSGKSYYQKATAVLAQWAEDTQTATDALKEWKNQIMGFDEINRLEDTTGTSTSRKTTPDYGSMFEEVELQDWSKKIKEQLAAIELVAGASMLGLGCILLFTGANIPLGLGLIVAGAAAIGHSAKQNWNLIPDEVKEKLNLITTIAGISLIAIGTMLALSGVATPLGLGLIAAGIGAFAANSAMINWSNIDDNVKEHLNKIKMIAFGLSFAVGVILVMTGVNIPLGMGLIGAGMIGTAVSVNWDAMFDGIKGAFKRIVQWWNNSVVPTFQSMWNSITSIFNGVSNAVSAATTHISTSSRVHGGISGSFAEGGTPTTGSLFWAGEAGPELVGSIGGQTTVTNTDQFGKAMDNQTNMLLGALNLLNKTVQEKDFDITLDGMSLARGIRPYSQKQATINGPSLINGVT